MFNPPVYIAQCDTYDVDTLCGILRAAFSSLGITGDDIRGKKIMLKPNLVLAKKAEFAATTHPAFVSAAVRLLDEMGAESIVLAESPGGQYTAAALGYTYRACEIAPLASDKLKLNDDYSFCDVHPDGVKLRRLHMIKPFFDADVIVDLCKLKTHSLTGLSCSTKNLFGLIPGIEKFEMHSNFPRVEDFSEMLVDLAEYVMKEKKLIAVCDGILSMEGNGPTHGTPKKTDLVLVSESTFALDVIAEKIIGMSGETIHLNRAAERGLCSRLPEEIEIRGLTDYPTFSFVRPDTHSDSIITNLPNIAGGKFAKLFETKPQITSRCVGCGKCAESCPKHTITVEKRGKKKRAVIHREKCIRCYCCQELCPIGAVGVWQNPIIKLIRG